MPFLNLSGRRAACRIPFSPGGSVRDILDATGTRVRSGCNGSGACGLCRVRVGGGQIHGPTAKEEYFIEETLRNEGVRLACQLVPEGDLSIEILSPAPESSWRSLPAGQVYSVRDGNLDRGISGGTVAAGPDCYGIAVDLGTTQVSLSLMSLKTGRRLAVRCGPNPQGEAGSDVMTRLVAAAGSASVAAEMSDRVVRAIGDGIHDIASREGLDLNRVASLFLVGNTAMLSLLSGRNYDLLVRPESWTGTIDCEPEDTVAWKTAWGIPALAEIRVLPPAGGFVGSDLLAGVLATGLTVGRRPRLLIDFGTNTEIALWDGGSLIVTSSAGGPAFEGCGIRCGLPAGPGAICRVRFSGGIAAWETIAGEEPCGLCGTGIVDLIAGLVRSESLDAKGRFAPAFAGSGFVLSGSDPVLVLGKGDVDVFQRAKAAVGAGVQILVEEAGIGYEDLDRIFVGGTFGGSLDTANAVSIGLLPPVSPGRIELCGNTALAGCECALCSSSAAARLFAIGRATRIINLGSYRDFDDIYLENLYLRPLEHR